MPANPATDPATPQPTRSTRQRPRAAICAAVATATAAQHAGHATQQAAAAAVGVPRSTLRGWQARGAASDLTPAQRAFFESPDGVHGLQALLTALLFVMTVCGGLGVAQVREVLVLAGLGTLVACSETTLRRARRRMLTAIEAWGTTQDAALAAAMPLTEILAAVDETFRDQMLLVAQDPGSGFVLVEAAADRRDAATWAQALMTRLTAWPVRVLALVGDEAKALARCATQWLHVPKWADLFHVEHALYRGTARALAQVVAGAEQDLAAAQGTLAAIAAERARAAARGYQRGDGDAAFVRAAHGLVALEDVQAAQAAVTVAEGHRTALGAAVRALGDAYHPVDLATGDLLAPPTVATRRRDRVTAIRAVVARAGVSTQQRVRTALNHAARVLPALAAMVTTWSRLATARIQALGLAAAATTWVWTTRLPVVYLDHRVPRGATADERARLRAVRDARLAAVHAPDSPWATWSAATRARVLAVVEECVALFVRTSSGLAGRNGQLALYQHRAHCLPPVPPHADRVGIGRLVPRSGRGIA